MGNGSDVLMDEEGLPLEGAGARESGYLQSTSAPGFRVVESPLGGVGGDFELELESRVTLALHDPILVGV